MAPRRRSNRILRPGEDIDDVSEAGDSQTKSTWKAGFPPRFQQVAKKLSGLVNEDESVSPYAYEDNALEYRLSVRNREFTYPLRIIEDRHNLYLETPLARVDKSTKSLFSELLHYNEDLATGKLSLAEVISGESSSKPEVHVTFGTYLRKTGVSTTDLAQKVSEFNDVVGEVSQQVSKRAEISKSTLFSRVVPHALPGAGASHVRGRLGGRTLPP